MLGPFPVPLLVLCLVGTPQAELLTPKSLRSLAECAPRKGSIASIALSNHARSEAADRVDAALRGGGRCPSCSL